ncbi:MAG TPA: Rid family hydrolase [Actinomycetota bacterium]
MTRDARQPAGGAAPTAPYSPAVVSGDLVWTAGQVALADGVIVSGGVDVQTRQALVNVAACLDAAGSSMDDVVKVTVFLADLGDFDAFNEEYRRHFAAPYPARTTVGAALPAGLLVEIDAVARRVPR